MYGAPAVQELLTSNFVEHKHSNEYQQFQNAGSETVVHMISRGVRVLLLQSGLPPAFWGMAALHVVTIYNCLPHASLDFEIPYTLQTGHLPDISWFRPFGCSAVVHQGKDLVEHHKLAPRGESSVFVGLGLMHSKKAWLVYSALLHHVFASTNATFDDTLFPSKETDQLYYGYYNAQPMETFRADLHSKNLSSTLCSDVDQMFST